MLAFVARRVFAEGVALVFAVRTQTCDDQFTGLRELEVRSLPDATRVRCWTRCSWEESTRTCGSG
ncbi:hypothetical protein GCM10022267_89700 [Lentzea roselyniae]|uniref:Secreted protein n=1 Tax=Lentzea roselyniae TaxID=531940 RepID=A0ABP7CEL9_9PSEU